MGKISKKPISIPKDVEIEIIDEKIKVKGLLGALDYVCPKFIKIKKDDGHLRVEIGDQNNLEEKAMQGTATRLIENMLEGVTRGFEKRLQLVGIGFNAFVPQEGSLILNIGFSHPVKFKIPSGIKAGVEKGATITIKGIDKQLVGETAARIRQLRKPDVYKGKGIKYEDEEIRKKAMKKVVAPTA